MYAAAYGHERLAVALLQRGASVNLRDSEGRTALLHAALSGHERVTELLVRCGAEIDQQACRGYTAR